jgi:hypothetical protein
LEEAMKACTRCFESKPLSAFGRQKIGTPDGLRYYCKECCCDIEKQRRTTFDAKHKQLLLEKSKTAIQADRDRLGDTYMRKLLQARGLGSFSNIPDALVELQRQRLLTMRLARQLKKAKHESSKDTDRIPGQHGSMPFRVELDFTPDAG